ncbi:hypothetical protein DFH09DRAFT_1114132 [Mycena vulgaris]|nr:hypothetical protein DFH09DRAFT_1114132 [Mycena vulgaris]
MYPPAPPRNPEAPSSFGDHPSPSPSFSPTPPSPPPEPIVVASSESSSDEDRIQLPSASPSRSPTHPSRRRRVEVVVPRRRGRKPLPVPEALKRARVDEVTDSEEELRPRRVFRRGTPTSPRRRSPSPVCPQPRRRTPTGPRADRERQRSSRPRSATRPASPPVASSSRAPPPVPRSHRRGGDPPVSARLEGFSFRVWVHLGDGEFALLETDHRRISNDVADPAFGLARKRSFRSFCYEPLQTTERQRRAAEVAELGSDPEEDEMEVEELGSDPEAGEWLPPRVVSPVNPLADFDLDAEPVRPPPAPANVAGPSSADTATAPPRAANPSSLDAHESTESVLQVVYELRRRRADRAQGGGGVKGKEKAP